MTAGEPRRWLYGLTADEWLHLAAEGEDSEVSPCCADISELREQLQVLAICQGPGESWIANRHALAVYEVALSSHDVLADQTAFPLLYRVLDGIRSEVTDAKAG